MLNVTIEATENGFTARCNGKSWSFESQENLDSWLHRQTSRIKMEAAARLKEQEVSRAAVQEFGKQAIKATFDECGSVDEYVELMKGYKGVLK